MVLYQEENARWRGQKEGGRRGKVIIIIIYNKWLKFTLKIYLHCDGLFNKDTSQEFIDNFVKKLVRKKKKKEIETIKKKYIYREK